MVVCGEREKHEYGNWNCSSSATSKCLVDSWCFCSHDSFLSAGSCHAHVQLKRKFCMTSYQEGESQVSHESNSILFTLLRTHTHREGV